MFIIASIPGTGTIFTVGLLKSLKEVQLCDNSIRVKLFNPRNTHKHLLNDLYQEESSICPQKILIYGHLHFRWMQFMLSHLRLDDKIIVSIRHPFNYVRTIYRRDTEIKLMWKRLFNLLTFLENPQKKLLLPLDLFGMYNKILRLKKISLMFDEHLSINKLEHQTRDIILKWKPVNLSDCRSQFTKEESNKLVEHMWDAGIISRLNHLGLPYSKYPPIEAIK